MLRHSCYEGGSRRGRPGRARGVYDEVMRFPSASFFVLPAAFALGGCDAILGLGDYKESAATGSGGNGGGSSSSTSSATTSSTSTGMTTSSGSGGSGGAMSCTPNEIVACPYLGTPGTEGHGLCTAGSMRCNVDGTGFEPCIGQVIDHAEDCMNGDDDDCDDVINDGCTCTPNQSVSCYSGPGGTDMTGNCHRGMATCDAQGTMLGPCVGEQTPLPEDCATSADENCNGAEAGGGPDTVAGCDCVGTTTMSCYSGPSGTSGVGKCAPGTKTCSMGHYPSNCPGEVLPTTEVCATGSGDEDCNGLSCSEVSWGRFAGDTASQQGSDLAVDPSGNVYWVGGFGGTMDLSTTSLVSAGALDVFVSKWSPSGTLLWAKRFGAAGTERGVSVTADANNVYVLADAPVDFGGGTKSGMTIAKLDGATGNHVWSRGCSQPIGQLGIPTAGGIAVDTLGAVYIGAPFGGASILCDGGVSLAGSSGGYRAGLIAKYDANGAYKWGRTFNAGSGHLEIMGVDTDAANSLWFTGHALAISTFGCSSTLGTTHDSAFIVRVDTNGVCSLQEKYDSANSTAYDISVDAMGAPAVVGDFSGSLTIGANTLVANGTDWFVAKLTSGANPTWSKALGGASNDQGRDIAFDSKGDVVAVGGINGTVNIGGNVYTASGSATAVVKLAKANGAVLWASYFGPSGVDGLGVAAGGSADLIYASGQYVNSGNIFGSFSAPFAGGGFAADAFLVRVDP